MMNMGRLRAWQVAVCWLLLVLEGNSFAHNGSVVLTSTVSNIVNDGDLSDWPDTLPSHPIAMNLYGDPLVGPRDCRGRFRVAVDPATKCLHLAIEIEDDSYVEAAPGHASWDTFDSCTAFVGLPHHPLQNRPNDSAPATLPVPTRFQRRTEKGYNVELLYDLAASGIDTVDIPRTAAFSVTLNDRDADGSFTALFWSPEISKNIHADRRGDLIINRLQTGRVEGAMTTSGSSDIGTSLIDFEAVDNPLLIFRLRTDPGGTYELDLPPGTYRRSTRGAPTETITVVAGESSQDEIVVKSEGTQTRSLADYTLSSGATPGQQELYPKKVGPKLYEMTTVNGLPKSRITSLAQGRLGSLWIGTESSIARFDGTQLQVFDTDLVEDVNAFYFDQREGQLWFAGENQVGFIRRDKVTTFPELSGQLASCVGRMHDNRICIGTRNGLFIWDRVRFRYQSTLNGLPHRFVTAIAADDLREVTWIGTQYGLVRFDGESYEVFDHTSGLGDPRIVDLHVAKNGTVWIGTNSSLYTLDPNDGFQLIRKHPTERVRYARSFAEAVDGTMYVAAFDGQLKIAADGAIEILQEGNCEAVILDGDSQLWLALENGALRRTDLGLQLVWAGTCSFVQTVGDHLWFVSEDAGHDWEKQRSRVVRFDKNTRDATYFDLTVEATKDSTASHPVLITELHVTDDVAWVGTKYHGVFRLEGGEWEQHRLPGRSVYQVTAIAEDTSQRVWIATTRHLYCVEDGGTRVVGIPGRPLEADIQCIATDSAGRLAIGTLMGVFVLDSRGELVAQYREIEGLKSSATTSLVYDNSDGLWIGTLGGLHRADDDITTNFDAESGLLKDHVAWFVRPWGSEIWSGSVAGINRICTRRGIVQHLVGADGLGQGHIYSVAPDGDCIWLAGESGLWIYRRGHRRPYLVLDAVVANEPLEMYPDGISTVTTDAKSVDYHFHAVSLKDRVDGTIYRYRLAGLDKEWRGVTTKNHVTIDVPSTGEYCFEAMAFDRDLLPSVLIRHKLIVGVPWLRMSTQYGLVVAVCSCIAMGIMYFRRIKRERRNLESRVADRTQELWEEIRHREIAESERTELQVQLQQMQKMEALGTLATGVAHDFNNSLLAISGNAELALMSDCSFEKDALLEELLSVTNQAAGLTNSMLMFGGKAASEKQAVDICQAITDAEKILRRTLPATIDFQSQVCLEPLYCDADVSQIQQVILNLAVNARDAMPSGGKITMTVERSGDMVRIHFADNGPGMAAPTLDRIFEPFYTEKPRGKGTGLGLSIVHGIIRDHGGTVVVQSKLGEGTKFRIAMPLSEADRQENVTPIRRAVRGHAKVLLADDDETVRKALSRLLAAAGFDVHAVQDGHQLVERFRADQDFELLIVDVDMPHKDGWQALQEIRSSSDSEIAAIVISGLPTHECLQDANTLFVRKPFSLHDLTSQAARLLQESV